MTRRKSAFLLTRKTVINDAGESVIYEACASLQTHISGLYLQAGLKGSSHSGPRTYATRILARTGGDMETLARLLGHSSIEIAARYVDVDLETLRRAFIE